MNFWNIAANVKYIGDYKTHKGNPSILRSNSMLKAIGKSINIRVSGTGSTKIPIIVLGSSPITSSYSNKVDFLKKSGIIQGFISLYPNPTTDFIEETPEKGFRTFKDYQNLKRFIYGIISPDYEFFLQ